MTDEQVKKNLAVWRRELRRNEEEGFALLMVLWGLERRLRVLQGHLLY